MKSNSSGAILSNILLSIFVVAIAAMLLVPLPTPLLDVLLALNISFSLLLLLVGLYMPNALALLAFPSILLLTTLFRLSLNVASSRLILSQGEAGEIIEAFGSFLISGEIVVGIIIFAIITIVNFIVIARGASRVSEVAARFALDALPGKQMAIDSDLRSGLLTPQQAERRREDLRKESQLYGAMDGAMKFVQGDAIAGVFIIFANILGGIYLGVQSGLSFAEAIETYTVLTVGDGLVSQIPALLISICAGIVVTRVSSGENTTLGVDLGAQLFKSPGLLVITALVVISIAALPGIPAVPFFVIAFALLITAISVSNKRIFPASWRAFFSSEAIPLLPSGSLDLDEGGQSRNLLVGGDVARVKVFLDAAGLYSMFQQQPNSYRELWRAWKGDALEKRGLHLPVLDFFVDRNLAPGQFYVEIAGTIALQGKAPLDSLFVTTSQDQAILLGLEVQQVEAHPLQGYEMIWVPNTAAQRSLLSLAEISFYDPIGFALLKALNRLLGMPEEVFSMADTHRVIKDLELQYPGLLAEVFNFQFINVARLTEIFQALSRDGISVRDVRQIIEAIASYCSTYATSMVQNGDFDLLDLLAYIRSYRKRQIIGDLLSASGKLRAISISAEINDIFEAARIEPLSKTILLKSDMYSELRTTLERMLEQFFKRGTTQIAILTSSELCYKVTYFLRSLNLPIRVLSFDELDSEILVEPAGFWSLRQN